MLALQLLFAALVTAAPDDEVRCREIDFALSVARQDEAAFAQFLHPEIRFLGREGEKIGREAFVNQWAPFFADDGPRIDWRPERVMVLHRGDLAVSRGPYRVISRQDSETLEQWGEFMSIWEKSEDGWMVIYDVAAQVGITPTDAQIALLDTGACGS